MKKMLASCLTCCALLGSMCFSSPMAQLHAESTEGGTATGTGSTTEKYDHDIELKVEEKEFPIRCTIKNAPTYSYIVVKGLDSSYKYLAESEEETNIPYKDGQFKVQIGEVGCDLDFGTENTEKPVNTYRVTVDRPATAVGDKDDEKNKPNPIITVDFSTGEFKFEVPENIELNQPISGEFYKEHRIVTNKTTEEVKPGDTFSLNLPGYFVSENRFMSTELILTDHADSLTSIEWDDYSSNTSLTGTITDEAKPKETISFKIVATLVHEAVGMTDYNPTLVTYNAPGDDEGEDPILGDDQYFLPIEFKIVDDGQGDIVDDGEEEPIFLTLTPEYKKLTKKGETFQLDASVEIDEDADAEAKASFETMKKDGQFKVSFVSEDTDVATVEEDGTVTAVANGSTEILAYVEGSEDKLFATSKVDVEIPGEVEETPAEKTPAEETPAGEADSTYPKTGDNFMAISAAILTLGLSALVVALMAKKQKDVNEEK